MGVRFIFSVTKDIIGLSSGFLLNFKEKEKETQSG